MKKTGALLLSLAAISLSSCSFKETWVKVKNAVNIFSKDEENKDKEHNQGEKQQEEHEHTFSDWKTDGTYHWKESTCEHTGLISEKSEHIDSNHDGKCDVCEKTVLINHVDDDQDHKCDVCGTGLSVCIDDNQDHKCDICGTDLSVCIDDNHDHICDICGEKCSEHNYVEGYCDICGGRDPDYNLLFLPSHISVYNSGLELFMSECEFEYDNDFHGFKTTEKTFDSDSFVVTTHRFNEDFTEHMIKTEEFYDGMLSYGEIEIYTSLGDLSYKVRKYDYDYDTEEYIFWSERTHLYNSQGRQTLYSSEHLDETGYYYYETYRVSEYDELGFITRETDYKSFLASREPSEIDCYSTYVYNENHTTCYEEFYYNNGESIVRDGYTVSTIEQKDGVIRFDEQTYLEDGEKFNHNVFEYRASDWTEIYKYYGGIVEEDILSIDEENKVHAYYNLFDDRYRDVKITYNENGDIAQTVREDGYIGNTRVQLDIATYSYNELKQISEIVCDTVDKDCDVITPAYTETVSVEFSALQNDILLSHMDYMNSYIVDYTDWSIFEGI